MHFESFYEKLTNQVKGIAKLIRAFFDVILGMFGKISEKMSK